jgi:hypothetical protein
MHSRGLLRVGMHDVRMHDIYIHAQRGQTQHERAEYERSCRGRHKATLFFSSKILKCQLIIAKCPVLPFISCLCV